MCWGHRGDTTVQLQYGFALPKTISSPHQWIGEDWCLKFQGF